MKIERARPVTVDFASLLEESIRLKDCISPTESHFDGGRYHRSGDFQWGTRKKNHFGISNEELAVDEDICIGWRMSENALQEDYDSAKLFKEAIWQQEAVDLELQLDLQAKRLELIRIQCSLEFDEKLKEYLKNPFKTNASLGLQQSASSIPAGPMFSSEPPSFVYNDLAVCPNRVDRGLPIVTNEIISTSQQVPCVTVEPANAALPLENADRAPVFIAQQTGISGFRLEGSIVKEGTTEKQTADCQLVNPGLILPSQTPLVTVEEDAFISPLRSSHPTLIRTDSRSVQSLFTSGGSGSTSLALNTSRNEGKANNEEQSTLPSATFRTQISPDEGTVEEADKVVSKEQSNKEGNSLTAVSRPPTLDRWIAFKEKFEADIHSFNSSAHNTLRGDLKYTINEKTAVWTKRYAKENEIDRAVQFFSDLLSGITVFGFNDKRINLKDDSAARNWAIAHILNAYINLVVQDATLVNVVAAVLSRVASRWEEFTLFLFGKLCASSLLLSMEFEKCAEKIVEMSRHDENASEATAAWVAREITLVRLFAAIHASWPPATSGQCNTTTSITHEDTSAGAPLLWLLTVATLRQHSPFAAALLTGLLTQSGWMLRNVYKKQFEKLLAMIGEKVIVM
uniref:GLE1 RNA export mediator n=1 Tax=Parascaris univalens TaxID=6257 RepID=A0A915AWT7_PARUN